MKAQLLRTPQSLRIFLLFAFVCSIQCFNLGFQKLFDTQAFEKLNFQNLYKKIGIKRAASNAPVISFPTSFEMRLSNNDPGLNLTEIIYMVRISCEVAELLTVVF